MESNEQQDIGIENQLKRSNGMVNFDRTGPNEKSGPARKVGLLFRNFSVWTEPIHSVLHQNFWKILVEGIAPKVGLLGLCNTTTRENLYCLELWQVAI